MSKAKILFIFFLIFLSCALSFNVHAQDNSPQAEDVKQITGTIKHFSYEGGFYGISGDDGNTYKPLRLSAGFQVEGRRVEARVRIINKKLLTGGWGIPVEILHIRNAE